MIFPFHTPCHFCIARDLLLICVASVVLTLLTLFFLLNDKLDLGRYFIFVVLLICLQLPSASLNGGQVADS